MSICAVDLPMSIVNCCLIFAEDSTDKTVRAACRRFDALRWLRACAVLSSQVVASLLVSVVLLGFKLSALKRLAQLYQRRTELKAALVSLQPKLEAEKLAAWLDDANHDVMLRLKTMDALEPASNQVHTVAEREMIEKGEAVFAQYDRSSAPVTQLKRSATLTRSETKLDEAGRLLLGRAEVEVRASPLEMVAYMLNYDGRHVQSDWNPAVDVRTELVARVNEHHTIVFVRKKAGSGLSDRTFLNSLVAKKVAENPTTYILVAVPIAQHPKISPKDEAGAVRAECFRSFRCTEVAPRRTKLEYVCSLDLKGHVPQFVTNMAAIPQQERPLSPRRALNLLV